MDKIFDFSGWATRHNLKCSDGRTILKDAFKHNDGQKVPLVWNHQHNDSLNVLGHAMLENRDEGVYAYCVLNGTESGKNAKLLVEHGDVSALSIYANQLKQQGTKVLHGAIREVSLVLAGANPGAFIDSVIRHDEESPDEAIIYTGEDIAIYHSEDIDKKDAELEEEKPVEEKKEEKPEEEPKGGNESMKHSDTKPKDTAPADKEEKEKTDDETVAEVFDTLTEKQKNVVYAMIGQALEDSEEADTEDDEKDDEEGKEKSKGGNETMKHNVFDGETKKEDVLSHADMAAIFTDAKRGTLKEAVIAHGITDIEFLFPDAKNVTNTPVSIQRDMGWVDKVMSSVHNTPFSRIKSLFADLTEEEARARGYLKGKLKKDEVFTLLKRTTSPQTVYKKQKLDRDDIIDIVDFDVVAWLKAEMRMMLNEELARAILVGDGRLTSSDDKINEQHIRPIWTDGDLFTIKTLIDDKNPSSARALIRAAIKARKFYKGSGSPTFYTTEDVLTDCLLIEDTTGRIIYDSVEKLANTLRVKEIIAVPPMEGLTRTVDSKTHELLGIITNLDDYNVGADKGGAVNMFDDFDIDYNAQKYLIETRCSGALVKPFSAIAIEVAAAG